eukprot:snap_masked-scaffold691_size110934-processed-gene-0.1 protein:Tk06095 transcript:snap_masked-scaffold691_size110934-processed-gene-0.1-mRNA-1 annotation:"gamma-aminobutyric acid receptor alpha-like"
MSLKKLEHAARMTLWAWRAKMSGALFHWLIFLLLGPTGVDPSLGDIEEFGAIFQEHLKIDPTMLWPKLHPEDHCDIHLDCQENEASEEGVGGPPLVVTINLSIRSMGPVEENDMVFSLDCYFRQSWVDKRLQYNATGVSELALNWQFLAMIWVPDTFVVNGRKSYLHKITVPNRFVRIYPNGRVSYSQRLTIWAECPMHLHKFPLDTQMCPLHFGSFGSDAHDIVYKWAEPRSVSIDKLGLAQFHLVNFKSFTDIRLSSRRTRVGFRNDSTASLEFHFERQTGFFLLQIYTPLILIVFCSWVAFWLIKTDKGGEVPARTVLGANAVLSIVNIGFGGKSRPPVGYATAMDIFIILCFVSVFAALLEFACINFLDLCIVRIKQREAEKAILLAAKIEEEEAKEPEVVSKLIMAAIPLADATVGLDPPVSEVAEPENLDQDEPETAADPAEIDHVDLILPEGETLEEAAEEVLEHRKEEKAKRSIPDLISQAFYRLCDRIEMKLEAKYGPITESYVYNNTTEVIWKIDEYARMLFPGVFLVLQMIYWISYLYLMPMDKARSVMDQLSSIK